MTGKLVLCATPIGNLGDMTPRVVQALKDADLIAAEDTRNSIRLLNHFDIHTPMTAYHENNRYDKGRELVSKMQQGTVVALITDAGTPGISDPGEELVRMCCEAGIPVTSLPGSAACITALTVSGLPTRRFIFEAFLPMDKKERRNRLEEMAKETVTIVLYEAPHRLRRTLGELCEALGSDRKIALCRELTKIHEEIRRTTLEEACHYYEEKDPKGEYVLVIAGRNPEDAAREEQKTWESISVAEHVQRYIDQGMDRKEAMKAAARDRGVGRREIYAELEKGKHLYSGGSGPEDCIHRQLLI